MDSKLQSFINKSQLQIQVPSIKNITFTLRIIDKYHLIHFLYNFAFYHWRFINWYQNKNQSLTQKNLYRPVLQGKMEKIVYLLIYYNLSYQNYKPVHFLTFFQSLNQLKSLVSNFHHSLQSFYWYWSRDKTILFNSKKVSKNFRPQNF